MEVQSIGSKNFLSLLFIQKRNAHQKDGITLFYFVHFCFEILNAKANQFCILVNLKMVKLYPAQKLVNNSSWKPNICIAFVYQLLDRIKNQLDSLPVRIERSANSLEFTLSIAKRIDQDREIFFGNNFW